MKRSRRFIDKIALVAMAAAIVGCDARAAVQGAGSSADGAAPVDARPQMLPFNRIRWPALPGCGPRRLTRWRGPGPWSPPGASSTVNGEAPRGGAGLITALDTVYGKKSFGSGDPPLMIVHGTADKTVKYSEAQALEKQWKAGGVPFAFYPRFRSTANS